MRIWVSLVLATAVGAATVFSWAIATWYAWGVAIPVLGSIGMSYLLARGARQVAAAPTGFDAPPGSAGTTTVDGPGWPAKMLHGVMAYVLLALTGFDLPVLDPDFYPQGVAAGFLVAMLLAHTIQMFTLRPARLLAHRVRYAWS